MLLFLGVNKGEPCPTMLRRRLGSAAANALARQSPGFEMKRDRWSEADIDELPGEETDAFDRKAGALFDDMNAFLDTLAKAVSAFANSGGGSLILGSRDDGSPDGLPATIGSTSMRDWIEQKLPNLVAYPINDFCVHTVQRSNNSRIPPDRCRFTCWSARQAPIGSLSSQRGTWASAVLAAPIAKSLDKAEPGRCRGPDTRSLTT